VLSATGLFATLYGVIEGPSKGWGSAQILGAFAIGAVLLVSFTFWELHSTHPMLDVRFFKNPRFSAASLAVTFVFFAMFGSLFFLSQYMQFVLGYDALQTGLRLVPVAVVLMIAAPTSSVLTRWFGSKLVVAVGLGIVAAGLFTLGQASTTSGYLLVVSSLVLLGLGMGTAMAPATDSIMGSLPPERAGVGSAVNDTTREVGGALGVAILGSIAASQFTSAMSGSAALKALPPQAVAAAGNSIGGAVTVASKLAGTPLASAAQPLLAAADAAFVEAMTHAVTIGGFVAVLGALVALVFLPARPRAEAARQGDLQPLVVSTARTLPTAPSGVLDAALSLLSEAGFASLNFSGVATRAGVSTATIERLWTSKLDLVTSVVERLQAEVPIPDTGALRRDCEQFVGEFVRMMSTPEAVPVIANLVGEAGRDPDLAAALRARLIAPRRAQVIQMLAAGQARGELPPHVDLAFLADLLVSPLYYRVLVSGEPIGPGLAREITDAVLAPAAGAAR
jgi:AcrR family transcriptional regulator